MRYSVLMSVYKNDDPIFLDTALKSVYEQQTKKPDEIVVVFDGPLTDALYSVLNTFAADKTDVVRYYPQQTNQGLGEALRIGSEHCTGDYIFRMDADDISHPQRFEKQSAFVERYPEIDVLGTDIAEFHETLNEKMRIRQCPAEHNQIVCRGKSRNPMNHVSVCIKRSSLMACGNYETLQLLEDYYLWLRMIVGGYKLANLHELLVYVRVGNGFENRRSAKVQIKGWKVLQKYMRTNGLISGVTACKNMVAIRVFVGTSPKLKTFLYKHFLRK